MSEKVYPHHPPKYHGWRLPPEHCRRRPDVSFHSSQTAAYGSDRAALVTGRYSGFGLCIESEILLPELGPVESNNVKPLVNVRLGSVPEEGLANSARLGPFSWGSESEFLQIVPGVARYLVQNGCVITIAKADGVDDDSVRAFLLSSVFGALLFQRALLVVHGTAVRIGEACVVCMGHPGVGTSTLAAGFHRRGFKVLADDLVAVDGSGGALPGLQRIKLWQDVVEGLSIDRRHLSRVRPGVARYSVPLPVVVSECSPIGSVFVIDEQHVSSVGAESIFGAEKILAITRNVYRSSFLQAMPYARMSHFKVAGLVAEGASFHKCTRPRGGLELDSLIDMIVVLSECAE